MVSPKTQPKIMHHHSSSSYAHHQRNNDQQQNQPQRKEEEGREERKLSRRLEGTRFEVITRNDPPATFKNFPTAESDYPSMADVFNVDSRQHLTFTGNDNSKRHFTETLRRLSLLPMQLPLAVRNYSSGITGIPGITHRRRKTETTTQRSSALIAVSNFLFTFRDATILLLTPLFFSPLLLSERPEFKCTFCVALMAVFWMTEVIPLAVTALLPVVLFPVIGILPAQVVAREFINDSNFLMMGGLIVATAVERCQLHERLALRVLTLVGSKPQWIMLGFMTVTAALSMFISNTATTAMMVPIAQSVIQQLMNGNLKSSAETDLLDVHHPHRQGVTEEKKSLSKTELRVAKGLILGICFAANIGGTGTLTGTPPNLVMAGMLPTLFPDVNLGVNFISWMAFAVPLMCISLLACWMVLCVFFIGCTSPFDDSVNKMMRLRYSGLPKMSTAEKSVSALFLLLILLWVGRDPQCIPGFGTFFPKGFYTDGTSAMLIAILLFVLPTQWPSLRELKANALGRNANIKENASDDQQQNTDGGKRLMDWPTMQKHFPWSVVFLLGGGFALALGVKESGLSALMGNMLAQFQENPRWALQVICIVVTMLITNICSNTVTASIFIPIVATMAHQSGLHPLALMMPTTLACSFAFMLPVGTPSNAIAFSSGYLKASDMILSGLAVSLITASIMVVYLATFSPIVFPGIDQVSQLLSLGGSNLTGVLAEPRI